MSLMFAALKKLEAPASTPATASTLDAAPRRDRYLLRRWSPVLAVAGLGLLGGWWLYASGAMQRADLGDATTIVSTAASTIAPPATVATVATVASDSRATTFALAPAAGNESTLVPVDDRPALAGTDIAARTAIPPAAAKPQAAATQTISTITAPAPIATPAVVATNMSTPPTAPIAAQTAPEPVVQAAPTPRTPARAVPRPMVDAISVRDASEATVTEDSQSVARAVAALGTAINNDDFAAGAEQLALLTRLLPPQSLTLLRMQAWLAHESGDTAGALALYRRIVARMPGDQTAVINLAILEARNGEATSARQRLQRLRSRDADSLEIERAISLVEAQLR